MTAKIILLDKPYRGDSFFFFIEYDSRLEADFKAQESKQQKKYDEEIGRRAYYGKRDSRLRAETITEFVREMKNLAL